MAWQEVGGNTGDGSAPIHKWTMTGQVVEGVFRGTRQGKYGPNSLIDVEASHGMVTCPNATALRDRVAKVIPGDAIRIEYLGKRRGKTGSEYQDFRVQVDKGRQAPAPAATAADGEFDRLVGLVAKEKGDGIATTLATVAKATGDPIASLRSAMDQIGVVPF